jgi:hypothetical protein
VMSTAGVIFLFFVHGKPCLRARYCSYTEIPRRKF